MKTLFSFVGAAALSTCALAQHGGDIVLAVESGRIVTMLEDEGGSAQPERVFASEFGEFEPRFTDEPGFDCDLGTFPFPSEIGFRIRGPLLTWNGVEAVGKEPASVAVSFASLGPAVSPACNVIIDGFALSVGSNGTWHRHLEFVLDDGAPAGVYILELELYSTHGSIGQSRPFWIVFNQESDEAEHDAAIDWAREQLAGQLNAADFDRDGALGVPDIFAFLSAWFAGAGADDHWRTDFDGSCTTDVQDIFAFLSAWFAG